jgi:D-3-phosphoglycerate dehydrogenase / 2-oxoglutarate reductase
MKRCLVVQPVHEAGLALLRENGIQPVMCPDTLEPSVEAAIRDCDAAITRDLGLSADAIRAGNRLRVVVVHGAGHDGVDKAVATACGVLVCNTPGANARSVVELALALALCAARQIPDADRAERAGIAGWREAHRTRELAGKTALIVGWGAIGSGLGRVLRDGFGMQVLVYSPRSPAPEGFETTANLAAGLQRADLISLHTPLRPETRHMIDAGALAHCRRGAILVNTARAGLVDEVALADALAAGRIAAAGLDVYGKGAPQGPLGRFRQVIFTPHLGGATEDALARVARASALNVITALRGERPATALNDPQGWMPCAT